MFRENSVADIVGLILVYRGNSTPDTRTERLAQPGREGIRPIYNLDAFLKVPLVTAATAVVAEAL